MTRQTSTAAACVRCGRPVSEIIVRFSRENASDLGGAIYCMRCQPIVRARINRPLPIPAWSAVLARYRTPTRLRTVAHKARFIVAAQGQDLRIVPDSSGVSRILTRSDFERAAPLLGLGGRGEVNEASRNSSYVQAILADFER